MKDWSHLELLLASASGGPWALAEEGGDIYVVNAGGEDVTGLATRADALADYSFIVSVRNEIKELLADREALLALLIENKVCPACTKKMNRQLYCVKCDLVWET